MQQIKLISSVSRDTFTNEVNQYLEDIQKNKPYGKIVNIQYSTTQVQETIDYNNGVVKTVLCARYSALIIYNT